MKEPWERGGKDSCNSEKIANFAVGAANGPEDSENYNNSTYKINV